ncbi:peptidoglycan-binding protein [Clostridium sp.]|uniref:peptidoglycan-binding protein n=1 Tax=Clostridium sp. TaxID=1506 RepID=UPI002FC69742
MNYSGKLKVMVFHGEGYLPYSGAKVIITPEEFQYNNVGIKELYTDSNGLTEVVELPAPSTALSQSPGDNTDLAPYSSWEVKVEAKDRLPVTVKGVQVFPGIISIQQINLKPITMSNSQFMGMRSEVQVSSNMGEIINIGAHGLYGNYEKKKSEEEEKGIPNPKTMYRVLPEVVIPDKIVVHMGTPNSFSTNHSVTFRDYIKNVASSEIYPTWSESTIRANIHCIVSFTLNRIFTEWYRSKGKNFDITNSTAYDHYFVFGRNIFENISKFVDEAFAQYIKRKGAIQPLFAQYCDGIKAKCPGHLTQWGSKYLGDQGKTPYEILSHFYGKDVIFDTSTMIRGVLQSYPGYILTNGARGKDVVTIQRYLNKISNNFPLIKKLSTDGIYGSQTKNSVKTFQRIFNLIENGTVDYATWYKISEIYVAVTRMAEVNGEGERESEVLPPFPGKELTFGSIGNEVILVQDYLNVLRRKYPTIIFLNGDGIYGYNTASAIEEFQRIAKIPVTGKVDKITWDTLVKYHNDIKLNNG